MALAAAFVAAGCGDDHDHDVFVETCSVKDQQFWLRDYMNDWYFWYAISPNPSPDGYGTLSAYFYALLYTGTDPEFPADRWSFYQTTESYDRFFGDGQTLGYGLRVAAFEVTGQPDAPLYVRYVDPGSPAAAAGIVRGDVVLSLDGQSSSSLITADDFSALTPSSDNDSLSVQVQKSDGSRTTVTLPAATYALVPVPQTSITTTADGRPMGYVLMTDMVSQAESPLSAAFSQFKAAGVDEAVIDLRYNGGGLVSVARDVASYVDGDATNGKTFASLLYNDKRADDNNEVFSFTDFSSALGLSRVYVITGERTCSASEQVINGLRPFVDVVTIGDTTCGKPVGFLPTSYCGTTYSVVNFESVNASNEGRYFDGFAPTCAVAEDFTQPIGGDGDPLLDTAKTHAATGDCGPAAVSPARRALGLGAGSRLPHGRIEPGEHQSMIPR